MAEVGGSNQTIIRSLSARRAWIEINTRNQPANPKRVALRKESVDRNLTWHCMSEDVSVALRKESVDRNINCNSNFTQKKHVALRKESVDRNCRNNLTERLH